MDKKSNRTDLLAAGRKKLQQYRQKKDHKGGKDGKPKDGNGSSKSSSKSAHKSELQDADPDLLPAVSDLNAESSQHSDPPFEVNTSLPVVSETLADSSTEKVLEDSPATSADLGDSSARVVQEAVLASDSDLPSLGPVSVGTSGNLGLNSDSATVEEEAKDEKHEEDELTGSTELDTVHHDELTPVSIAAPRATFDVEPGAAVFIEAEPLEDGDQVSAVGAMQEPESLDSAYADQNVKLELDRECEFPVSVPGEGVIVPAVSESISEKLTTPKQSLDVSANGSSEGEVDHRTAEASVPIETSILAVETSTSGSYSLHLQGDDMIEGSSNGKVCFQASHQNEEHQPDSDGKVAREYDETYLPVGSTGMVKTDVNVAEQNFVDTSEMQSVSSGLEGNSIDLIDLAEVLKKLPEGDFWRLIKSREMVDHAYPDMLQTFQEQLFVANILKDCLQLQFAEHHEQPIDLDRRNQLCPLTERTVPFSGLQESNEILTTELAQCKFELEAAKNERFEFQNLYHNAKEDAVQFSAKADELRVKLDETLGNLSSLSAELVDCRAQLEASQGENEKLLKNLASVSEQSSHFEEIVEQHTHESQKLSIDLAASSSQLAALQREIEELNVSLASATDEKKKSEEDKVVLSHEKEMLSGDLVDCRRLLAVSQQENSVLSTRLALVDHEHDMQTSNVDLLEQVIERLSTHLVVSQYKLSIQHQEREELEADLEVAMSRLEQMTEENIILQSSLEIYKAKISEVDRRHMQIFSPASGSSTHIETAEETLMKEDAKSVVSSAILAPNGVSVGTSLDEIRSGFLDDASVVVFMKGYLEEAEKVIQKLEKTTEGMHSHSVSLSRSAGRNTAPGISKLIQAFESKAITDDPEGSLATEDVSPSESYLAAVEQMSHLRGVLRTLAQNVEHVDSLMKGEKVRCEAADFCRREAEAEIEALKGISNNLEVRNIELEVLFGAMDQHAREIEANKTQLEDQLDALERENAGLQLQNIELVKKLSNSHSKLSELQAQLKEMRRISDEVACTFNSRFDTLQRELMQDIYAVEGEWKSAVAQLLPMVKKLHALVGSGASYLYPSECSNASDIVCHFSSTLSTACEMIENLVVRLDAHETLSSSYREVNERLSVMAEEQSSAVGLLRKLSAGLVEVLNLSAEYREDSSDLDLLDPGYYEGLMVKLTHVAGDFQLLKETNKKLSSDLLNKERDIEELNKSCVDNNAILKIVFEVKGVLNLQDAEMDTDKTPASLLQSSVLLLIQRFKELEKLASSLTEDSNSRMIESGELQGSIEQLSSLILQHQSEILVLREGLTQAKLSHDAVNAELVEKNKELEQSEKRLASVREKLGIAVAKGKGLVVQRDTLKQSLAEMSIELEKCSQEMQLKHFRLLEVEEKLKAYSEAGERMEALESELTYIRNSATALRESFLMKDSALQRIEEIMEDLELPDHFYSKDIVEKVDWLAKSVANNSLLRAEWDQRSSVGGGSYSDTGLVTDGGKEDLQPSSNPVDDLRRKYDELQTKFYELAEQNDMLEQSLMERNILVQRWEEVLDRINTPPQIRSMEPEERIHWLGTALSEADQHMRSLQQKIEKLENYCESLSGDLEDSRRSISEHETSLHAILQEKEIALLEADDHIKSLVQKIHSLEEYCGSLTTELEDSQRRITDFESSLQVVLHDREILSSKLVSLSSDHELALHTVAQYEHDLDRSRKEADVLRGNLAEMFEKDNYFHQTESELRRLQDLILEVLQNSGIENESSDASNIQYLEKLIRRLLTCHRGVGSESNGPEEVVRDCVSEAILSTELENEHVPVEAVVSMDEFGFRNTLYSGQNVADLRKELAEALDEVVRLQEEKNAYTQKNQYMAIEFDALNMKKNELQELLAQEEQKTASLREKLNLAVRKGKYLVQQRDSLKQNIEEMMTEIDRLKSEMNLRDNSLLESGQKISDMSLQLDTFKAFEAENSSLKKRLMEAEQHIQQNGYTLSMVLHKLGEIDVGEEFNACDPLQKLEGISKVCFELHATAASFEQEAKKSKKAAELLLAELNEVQERNDGLQEELARAHEDISTLSQEREMAESAKAEALSHLAKLSEERRIQIVDFERLKLNVDGVKKFFFDVITLTDDLFAKDLELFHGVKAHVKSCLEHIATDPIATKDVQGLLTVNKRSKDFLSHDLRLNSDIPDKLDRSAGFDILKAAEQQLQLLAAAMGDYKDRIQSYSMSVRTEAEQCKSAISNMLRDITSEKNLLESTLKERGIEGDMLRRSISLLYEACSSSIMEIENRKTQLVGQSLAAEDFNLNLPSLPSAYGRNSSELSFSSAEECVKALADKLLVSVKDFLETETENVEGRGKEMRSTISSLQKELQEKDIQRERICMQLVSQLKEAENAAARSSRDLQSVKDYACDLENKLEGVCEERTLLEQRVAELQQGHLSSIELGEKVKALTDLVAVKEQEIDTLMQALDEEENQMESLRNKIEDLEKTVLQKNIDLEHIEGSRAKAVKKLSVTVSKFDELHHMTQGLLSEVENLQSQLQDRDGEISFLRQEVTRCTNDVLEATRMAKEKSSTELHEFLTWLGKMLSHVLKCDTHSSDDVVKNSLEYKEHLQKDITFMISELNDLRLAFQNKDALLQVERSKVEELSHRKAALEASLNEKELYLSSLEGGGVSGLGTSEIIEVEPVLNKWTAPVTSTTSQVRSLRKSNNDQVAIAIDADAGSSGRFEDEEDDKVHGFKSLTTSRFVPKFTRPVSDMMDGLWVSCDRALMRQPALRLSIMFYWVLLHAFFASIIV